MSSLIGGFGSDRVLHFGKSAFSRVISLFTLSCSLAFQVPPYPICFLIGDACLMYKPSRSLPHHKASLVKFFYGTKMISDGQATRAAKRLKRSDVILSQLVVWDDVSTTIMNTGDLAVQLAPSAYRFPQRIKAITVASWLTFHFPWFLTLYADLAFRSMA